MIQKHDPFTVGYIMGYLCAMRRVRQGRVRALGEAQYRTSMFTTGVRRGYQSGVEERKSHPFPRWSAHLSLLEECGRARIPVLWSHLRIHYYLAFGSVFVTTLYALAGDLPLTLLWILSSASLIEGIVLRWNAITALKRARAARGIFGAVLADL